MRIDVADELLATVLAAYPLAGPRATALLEASTRNENFRVEDAAGRRYVLRRYRRNPNEARVRFQLRFQQELYGRGYPTSEIIESKDGGPLVREGGDFWAVFSHVEGAEYDFSRMEQVAEAGRRLAQFHWLTADIDLDAPRLDINFESRRWWTHGDDQLAALEKVFRDDEIAEELAFLRSWHAGLLRAWPLDRLDALPVGWVHSDFHGRNMVFAGDELRGLFDFDPLHRGFWVEDLGHALFMFARERRGSTHVRPDAARLFLGSYAGVRPLSDEERAAIPMMAVLAWVPLAPYHELLRRDGDDSLAFFRHYVQLMRDLQAEMERLCAALGDVLG